MIALAFATLALVGVAFALVATIATLMAPRGGAREDRPAIVLLRCAEALDDELGARWSKDSTAYSGAIRRVVVVPAGGVVGGAHVVASGIAANVVGNRKSLQLAMAHREAETMGWLDARTIVVHADADVELGPGDLDRLVEAVDDRTVAFAVPAPRGGAKLAELTARAIVTASPQAFAVVCGLARMTRSAPALAGKLVAIPAPLLDRICGYETLVGSIGDDVALVDAVTARGGQIRMARVAAVAVDERRTFRSLNAQLARWLRVASLHRPGLLWAYPTVVASLPIALVLAPFHPMAALAFGGLYGARLVLGLILLLGPYRGRSSIWALAFLPLGDLLLLRAALAAAGSTSVTWSGRVYHLGKGGSIETVEAGAVAAATKVPR
ncbi:hypothetical protein BH09MYX1_BH09MYX1_03330 [soil metagenome]